MNILDLLELARDNAVLKYEPHHDPLPGPEPVEVCQQTLAYCRDKKWIRTPTQDEPRAYEPVPNHFEPCRVTELKLTKAGRSELYELSVEQAEQPQTPQAESDEQPDDNDWILVSEALARLSFLPNRKALYRFAEDHPDKLRLRQHPTHGRRRQANAADVLRLEMEHDSKTFAALGGPAADDLPSVSEEGLKEIAERVARTRANKRK